MKVELKSRTSAGLNIEVTIVCGSRFYATPSATWMLKNGLNLQLVTTPEQFEKLSPQVVILDDDLKDVLSAFKLEQSRYLLIAEEKQDIDADLFVPDGFSTKATLKNIQHSLNRFLKKSVDEKFYVKIQQKDSHINKLTDLALALSSEKNLSTLLERILLEGRKLAVCDAASLYLLEGDKEEKQLVFKLVQNASIEFPFQQKTVDLDEKSIAGYVATHGEEIIVEDAYQIPNGTPFTFNKFFDKKTGYRSISLIALPIKNHQDEVIGVLQFINKKDAANVILVDEEMAINHVVPFDMNTVHILRALASFSAIAIENKILTENIKQLFDGFVSASVEAIEQRDPTTSGHSFRVADLSLALADNISRSGLARFKDVSFNGHQLKELKYAALLHDFGKVGVRESVLTKAKKLHDSRLFLIQSKICLIKERLKREYFEQLAQCAHHASKTMDRPVRQKQLEQQIKELDGFWEVIKQANEPSVLSQKAPDMLRNILNYNRSFNDEEMLSILEAEDFDSLTIPRGSLTEEERDEIQSHVTHTENFLRLIPWTKELSNIPKIAGAHHEKLNGSGYPKGLTENEIPLQSKIMTICDIFDALTASDRPYKPAVSLERAFDILNCEAKDSYLDKDLVKIFIESKAYAVLGEKDYSKSVIKNTHYCHHVCDFDFLKHEK